ncbi:hypothetical protein [Enterococcus rotai]|uniref:hypothetical protein n=1 Tax=Enterococcus rotai TaxID=118060 RepID=UPI0032B57623
MTEKTTLEMLAECGLTTDQVNEAITDYLAKMRNQHQPAFAVGEYYVSDDGDIYKITSQENLLISIEMYSKSSGRFLDMTIPSHDPQDTPATAEQIATFKRAESFASKGRKLDEFRVGDKVKDGYGQEREIVEVDVWGMHKVVSVNIAGNNAHFNAIHFDLNQTVEELQEVGDGN